MTKSAQGSVIVAHEVVGTLRGWNVSGGCMVSYLA